MSKRIEGIITAVVTPFSENENIDKSGFRRIITHLIDSGVNGLFPVGSQGEFFSLTVEEKKELISIAIDEAKGRVFVMPNVGGISTRETIELAGYAEKAGADCVSVITPFYISPNQDELYDHYKAVCESVALPVLAYNNPGRTGGLFLAPVTVARLAQDIPNFAGIKDSTEDMTHILEIIRLTPPGFRFIMGRDTLIYSALVNGAVGAIAATSNVAPKLVVGIYQAFRDGDHEKSKECQRQLAPLRVAFGLGTFPVVVKEALNMLGLPAGRCRRPIQPLSKGKRENLRKILVDMGLLPGGA